jgi:serine/threonine protein kinase
MGCKYDYKIDLWSLGCIMAELYTGNVLFQSDSVHSLMARIVGIAGPIPDWMYEKGETVKDIFTKEKLIYMEAPVDNMHGSSRHGSRGSKRGKKMHVIVPKKTSLKKRIRCDDENFLDFLKKLLTVDPNLRLSAKEALKHKWLTQVKY